MATTQDVLNGLTGPQRDAYTAVTALLEQYGLGELAPTVRDYVVQGYSSDTIAILLPSTAAYQRRFAGNAARQKAGLPVLAPAEYLAVEDSYRQVMRTAGLPAGFYDQASDFQAFIEKDVSPTELQDRVATAAQIVQNGSPEARAEFARWYGATDGDVIAYALDPERAAPLIEKQWVAAQAGAAGSVNGLPVSRAQAESIASLGINGQQASTGVAQAAALAKPTKTLSDVFGDGYTTQDALDEVFASSTAAATKRKRLASKERAQFAGSAATSTTALTARRAGQV